VGREQSGACAFLLERPTRVRAARSGTDILDAWMVRTYLTAAAPFPGPQRSAGVVAVKVARLNPVEAAIVQLAERTAEYRSATGALVRAPTPQKNSRPVHRSTNRLGMRGSGLVMVESLCGLRPVQ
jgi:hypothetical protein